ncbi:photosystem II protein PsbQ [Chroococcidiopsis sp. FACHB-1243]|uniref:photosystem II protein PsbQ n=1 Tax=Chroococcidiopsis sp. [FACHB-1243] TaxID=2692781 RepID=UPI00177CADA0|nr:photosystem II protein PsbQ [Chroococcidiopsis sp. [FACHB-1243]]MBD2304914.1 photosystem II protein PsbQ [Chroococcidiopsis sp. [FACHB-1243]]
MLRHRSFLSLILVILATFLIGCSSPGTATVPPTYSSAQIQQIQQYIPDIQSLRDRASREIPSLVQRKDWIDVGNFVHGPLGELRLTMNYMTRNLLPQDQSKAKQITRNFFNDLVAVDQAAQQGDAKKALLNAREAIADIDNFLQLLPQTAE